MAKGVTRCRLGYGRSSDRLLERPLKRRFVQVVAPVPVAEVAMETGRREDPLPAPLPCRSRVLPFESVG
jgi:hypothetical protein